LWERLCEVGLPKDFNGIAPNEEEVFKIVFYLCVSDSGCSLDSARSQLLNPE
jgi:hypothetical protein